MGALSIEQLTVIVLGISLLIMAGINVFALMKLLPLIDSEDKGIHEVKEISERTHQQLKLLCAKLEALSTSPDGAMPWLDQFEAPFQGISTESIDGIDESMAATQDLLGELENMSEADLGAWRAVNQLQIKNLMKTQEGQRRRLASLRMELDQARAVILGLRSGTSRNALNAVQAAALQAKNTNIEAELWSIKSERTRLGNELKQAQKELQALQVKAGNASGMADGANDELAAQCRLLEAKVAELAANNASLQATYERSMLEKQFIEDAFVRMDKMLGIGGDNNTDAEAQAL